MATLWHIRTFHPGMSQEERYRRFMRVRVFFNPELAVGQHEKKAKIRVGQSQFEYLKSCGMRPHHRLLDYGCGAIRGGRHAIPYLDPGNYYGVDISEDILRYASEVLREHGLEERKPTLQRIDSSGIPFEGQFDFVIAQSVFTHTDPETTQTILRLVAERLESGSKLLGTFWLVDPSDPGAGAHDPEGVDYRYSRDEVGELAANAGLTCEFRDDYVHPSQQMVIFTPSAV